MKILLQLLMRHHCDISPSLTGVQSLAGGNAARTVCPATGISAIINNAVLEIFTGSLGILVCPIRCARYFAYAFLKNH